MESRRRASFLLLLVFICNCESMLFPVEKSILGTACVRKDKQSGSAKLLERCPPNDESPNEYLGFIIGKVISGTVVCCPNTIMPSKVKVKILSPVGSKARAYCSSHSSTTLSPLVQKVIGGNFSDVGEFPHLSALGYKNLDDKTEFKCCGALISRRFDTLSFHDSQLFTNKCLKICIDCGTLLES